MIDIEGFLVEYEALCKKYKIIVGTFGCPTPGLSITGLSIVEKYSNIEKHVDNLRRGMDPLGERRNKK